MRSMECNRPHIIVPFTHVESRPAICCCPTPNVCVSERSRKHTCMPLLDLDFQQMLEA